MANNQNVNKVVYAGTTLIDLTGDDVTAGDVLSGKSSTFPAGRKRQARCRLSTAICWTTGTLSAAAVSSVMACFRLTSEVRQRIAVLGMGLIDGKLI